jgi:hypothetical protein
MPSAISACFISERSDRQLCPKLGLAGCACSGAAANAPLDLTSDFQLCIGHDSGDPERHRADIL